QPADGRARLREAFERARLVAVDVTAELSPLGEPLEYVDLTPTTGPVPIMIPAASIGDASAVDVIEVPPPADDVEEAADTDTSADAERIHEEIDDDDATATD